MKCALVIGYCNDTRCEDAVAHTVLDRLRLEGSLEGVVELKCRHLTPELADLVAGSRMVVFVDSSCGQEPGRVAVSAVAPVELGLESLSHSLDPELLLGLAQWLYGAVPPAFTVRIDGAEGGAERNIPPSLAEALPRAVETIREILSQAEAA